MATRDACGILRPGMFEQVPLDEEGTVATPISGRGGRTRFVASGPNANPVEFDARSKTHVPYAASEAGATKYDGWPSPAAIRHG